MIQWQNEILAAGLALGEQSHSIITQTAAYPKYTEVSVMGIRYTSGRRGKCARAVEHDVDEIAFSDLSVVVPWRERVSTISSSANIIPAL